MKNKGFTVVEMVTSFALAAIIVTLLFSVVLSIKNIYSTSAIKTEMLIEQSNLSKKMNQVIKNNDISSYSICVDENYDICYEFNHISGNSYKLLINTNDNIITFDNYTYKLGNNSKIGKEDIIVSVETIAEISSDYNNSFLHIKIPIYNSSLSKEDLGINLVYPFNSSILTNFSI